MKKQRSTYAVRREETQRLRDEVQRLAEELKELEFRRLSAEDVVLLDPEVKLSVAENRLMTSVAKNQQLTVARVQSVLASSLGPQEAHPLYTRICLTKDWDERQKTLMAVRQQKLRNGYDFLMAAGRFTDPKKPQTSDHRYESPAGDICAMHSEVVHFPGVASLEKVWEAVLFHYNNIEIDISEKLGHTTVRDDYDSIDGSVQNIRVMSRSDSCVAVESSIVTFSHLFSESDEGFGGQACGVLALDSIDEDALYPYFFESRARLDTSGAIVITATRRVLAGSDSNSELVVTLRRAAFVRLHNPEFPISEAKHQQLQEGIGRWGDVLMKTIRGYVYGAA